MSGIGPLPKRNAFSSNLRGFESTYRTCSRMGSPCRGIDPPDTIRLLPFENLRFAPALAILLSLHWYRSSSCIGIIMRFFPLSLFLLQVAFVLAGTLIAAALVAMLGDTSAHKALLAARSEQESQLLAGSWAADHRGMQRLALKTAAKAKLATKVPGDQSSDDDTSGNGDVSSTAANKMFGVEAGEGGADHEPPYEVDSDSDIGLFLPHSTPTHSATHANVDTW